MVRGLPFLILLCLGGADAAEDPPLTRLLSDDPKVRQKASADVARAGEAQSAAEGLVGILKGQDPAKRIAAARGIEALGPRGKVAVSPLTDAIRLPDPDLRRASIKALGAIGTEALKESGLPLARILLKPTLGSTTENELAYAALQRMGGKPRTHLLRALKSPDPRRRALGATLLGRVKAKEALGALSNALRDKDWFCRWKAAEALGNLGTAADRAAPSLARLLRDPKAPVRRAVAKALGQIGNERAVPGLAKAVGRTDDYVSRDAALALERFGPKAAPALEALTAALKRKPIVAHAAIDTLGRLGAAAKPSVPALAEALGSDVDGVRERAARALGRLGPSAAEAVDALIKALERGKWNGLRKKTEWGGVFATWALSRIGPKATPAIPALTTLTESSDRRIKKAASAALKRLQKHVPPPEPEPPRRSPKR